MHSVLWNQLFDASFILSDTALFELNLQTQNGEAQTMASDGNIFDVWLTKRGVLHSFSNDHMGRNGVRLVRDGEEILRYQCPSEVFSCQPLPNGGVLVGEVQQKQLTVLDASFRVARRISVVSATDGHDAMRAARQTRDGSFLVVHPFDHAIRRYNDSGRVLEQIDTEHEGFAVVEQPDGGIWYTNQYGVVHQKDGRVLLDVDLRQQGMGIGFLTGMQVLSDGSVAVCNWLGHGQEGIGPSVIVIGQDGGVLRIYYAKNQANIAALHVLERQDDCFCK